MTFFSLTFYIVLVFIVALYYSISKIQLKKTIVLISSLVFYSQFSWVYLIVLIFTILITYLFGVLLEKNQNKLLLVSGISINVALLLFFKYNYIFESKINNVGYPIGLSFYIFQSVSYLIDIFKGKHIGKKDLISVSLYLSFFPKLLAGPIEKPSILISQFDINHSFDIKQIFIAFKIITYGLFCKIIIADGLGQSVNDSISKFEIISGAEVIIVSFFYSLQIYFDFFSYSILAIGLGKLFGIELTENFDRPYMSISLKRFWRRWNITLMVWLRDYIYIPIGGNRVSRLRHSLNILIVFTISGIWHGAKINYIIWGFLHGILFNIEYLIRSFLKSKKCINSKILRVTYIILMFSSISILWLIFRVEEFEILKKLFSQLFNFSTWFKFHGAIQIDMIIVLITISVFILQSVKMFKNFFFKNMQDFKHIITECILLNIFLILILIYGKSHETGFIYFQF